MAASARLTALAVAACITGWSASVSGAAAQSDPCPNASVRGAAAQSLPDCRAYELVSPRIKSAGWVQGTIIPMGYRTGESGDVALYPMNAGEGGAPYLNSNNVFAARRGADAWSTALASPLAVYPPQSNFVPRLKGMSPDGRHTLVATNLDPRTGTVYDFAALFRSDLVTGEVTPIALEPLSPGHGSTITLTEVVGNHDWSVIYFSVAGRLYRWTEATGVVDDVAPGDNWLSGIASAQEADPGPRPHVVGADGAVVFHTPDATGPNARVLRTEVGHGTVLVNAAENGDIAVPEGAGTFQGASGNADTVVFKSAQPLVTGMGASPGANLFLYRHSADPAVDSNLTLLTEDLEPADGTAANAYRVLGMADDGGVVYFSAQGQIVAGAPTGSFGKVYKWRDGEVTYLGRIGTGGAERKLPAMATRDGAYLLFFSSIDDAGSANTGGLAQAFVYDEAADSLTCASCRLDGAPAANAARLKVADGLLGNGPVITALPARALGQDGAAFFQTKEPLVGRDVNGAFDIYMWKAGTLSLISDGRTTAGSDLADVSLDGGSVFFRTTARLVAWDTDTLPDLYVARAGGGQLDPRPHETGCQGEGCQPLGPMTPGWVGPASERATGEDTSPAPCPRLAARARKSTRRARVLKRRTGTARRVLRRQRARRAGRPARHRTVVRVRRLGRNAKRAQRQAVTLRQALSECRSGR